MKRADGDPGAKGVESLLPATTEHPLDIESAVGGAKQVVLSIPDEVQLFPGVEVQTPTPFGIGAEKTACLGRGDDLEGAIPAQARIGRC